VSKSYIFVNTEILTFLCNRTIFPLECQTFHIMDTVLTFGWWGKVTAHNADAETVEVNKKTKIEEQLHNLFTDMQ